MYICIFSIARIRQLAPALHEQKSVLGWLLLGVEAVRDGRCYWWSLVVRCKAQFSNSKHFIVVIYNSNYLPLTYKIYCL